MNEKLSFDPPWLPPVCQCCGAGGRLAPHEITYQHNSANLLTALALLVGMIYYQEMTYKVHLPLCDGCAGHRRRKRPVMFLMWFGVAVLTLLSSAYGMDHPELFALPAVSLVAAVIYSVILQRRGQPRKARINNDLLVIDVPGYGEVTLFERHPAPGRFEPNPAPRAQASPPRPPRRPAGPQLNRSICEGCGFINFASAVECKKCHAPLGAAAEVGAV